MIPDSFFCQRPLQWALPLACGRSKGQRQPWIEAGVLAVCSS
jgi:hypothetical protein